MIFLDENIPESQRQLLRGWGIRARQIGSDVGQKGMHDDTIIPLILKHRRSTFFTLDCDFFQKKLCHVRYCLVYLHMGQYEAAPFIRRLLCEKEFDTEAKRMGTIIRVSHTGLSVWRIHAEEQAYYDWA